MSYQATILADSVGPHGVRLTTMEVTFPRSYLAEFNTHRDFSRSSESSRAIPPEIEIERVEADPYVPEFAYRVKGMGVGEPLTGYDLLDAQEDWLAARDEAVWTAKALSRIAKDQANRLLEPFMWHTAIVTATEWTNFLNLRDHPSAAPPMRKIAGLMREALEASEPKHVGWGGWHLPLVGYMERELADLCNIDGAQVSAGRCARSSYSNHLSPETPRESQERWDRLALNAHWSPAEHPARVVTWDEWATVMARQEDALRHSRLTGTQPDAAYLDRLEFTGNFRGWVQLRKHYAGEAVFWDAGVTSPLTSEGGP